MFGEIFLTRGIAISLRADSTSSYGVGHNLRVEVGVPLAEAERLNAVFSRVVGSVDHKAIGLDMRLANHPPTVVGFTYWLLEEFLTEPFSRVTVNVVGADGLRTSLTGGRVDRDG
jgi:hypothetical protein